MQGPPVVETVVFVEVKARTRGGRVGAPEEALTAAKMARVARAAEYLLRRRGVPDAPRVFLGAAVDLERDGRPSDVRLIPVEGIR